MLILCILLGESWKYLQIICYTSFQILLDLIFLMALIATQVIYNKNEKWDRIHIVWLFRTFSEKAL